MSATGKKLHHGYLWARWTNGVVKMVERFRRAVLGAVAEETTRAIEESESGARDLFDELPDPPHLEYGEVRYRNGRFKYFDG